MNNTFDLKKNIVEEIKPYEAPSVTLAKFNKKINTFIINICTLLKISFSNHPTDEPNVFHAIVGDLRRALTDIAEGIVKYVDNTKPTSNISVILYYNRYDHIPDTFRRQLAILDRANEVIQYLKKNPSVSDYLLTDMDNVFQSHGYGNNIVITNAIDDRTMRNTQDVIIKNRISQIVQGIPKICFISNFPIDYHVNYDYHVLSTFTGDIWDKVSISEKLFDDLSIPFNEESHLLLGDKTLIKPLLKYKVKSDWLDKLTALPKYQINTYSMEKILKAVSPGTYSEMKNRMYIFR